MSPSTKAVAPRSTRSKKINLKLVDLSTRRQLFEQSSSSASFVDMALECPMEDLTSLAKRIYEEALNQLEQSGNIKATIKGTVTDCLYGLYSVVERYEACSPSPVVPTVSTDWSKELKTELEQQREIVAAARADMGAVRTAVNQLCVNLETNGVTYAAMAATTKSAPTLIPHPQSVHSLIISSADTQDTSEDVIGKIRNAVSAKTSGLRVDRLRKVRDQKVVLGCQTRDELAKVADRLRSGNRTLLIEEKENKDPLVILKNVLNYNTDEDILCAL
ncbi:jg27987, partial [Pararge aegeria aegeria]